MARRIYCQMRWGILLALWVGGCGAPVEDSPPPFLLLRHHHSASNEDAPDGGTGGQIPAQTIGDKGDPSQPVD